MEGDTGFIVPPLSRREIRQIAQGVRSSLRISEPWFPIVEVLEFALPTLDVPGTRRCFKVPNNDTWGAIRVNLVGREPAGRVHPGAEYDRFCEQLMQDLRALVDVDGGRPLVRRIVRTEDVYPRRPDDDLPDLLVEWHHDFPVRAATSPLTGLVRGRYGGVRTGDHRPDGFVLARGPVRAAGTVARNLRVEDLAPTIAALLGVTLDQVDGRPAAELLEALGAPSRGPRRSSLRSGWRSGIPSAITVSRRGVT